MFRRIIAILVCLTFITSYYQPVYAQDFNIEQLPMPGSMINVTPAYVPLTLKGLIIHPENALKFDFLMDPGRSNLKGNDLKDEALKIMKYFLTALTIPEDDLWVNLSPYEKDRIIQNNLGQTMMGRDLLAQDYILKQLTASLIYPEKALGKEFWQKVYSKAAKEYGTTQIPVNTFNKVWIVPAEAVVWEHDGKVLIVKSRLKVMLEEDYLALSKHQTPAGTHSLASNIVRAIVLPVLEKEVNEGKNFAQLRQMYQAMILATWYKKALKTSILNKDYANQKKTKGIDDINRGDIGSIYHRYLKAFKKGAFNYIKEDIDPSTGQTVPRKYFSGGFSLNRAMVGGRIKTFAFALVVWAGALTAIQQNAIAQAAQGTGSTIVVSVNEDRVQLNDKFLSLEKVKQEIEGIGIKKFFLNHPGLHLTESECLYLYSFAKKHYPADKNLLKQVLDEWGLAIKRHLNGEDHAMLSQSLSDYVIGVVVVLFLTFYGKYITESTGDEWSVSARKREEFLALVRTIRKQAEGPSEKLTLSSFLKHQETTDVVMMIRNMGDMRDERNLKTFLKFLKEDRKEIGLAAAEAILETGGYKHVEVLKKLLKWYWKNRDRVKGNVFQLLDQAIKFTAKYGDFQVIFEPQETEEIIFGHESQPVINKIEVLYIEKPNQAMLVPATQITLERIPQDWMFSLLYILQLPGSHPFVTGVTTLGALLLLGSFRKSLDDQMAELVRKDNLDGILETLNDKSAQKRYKAWMALRKIAPIAMRLKILEKPSNIKDMNIRSMVIRGLEHLDIGENGLKIVVQYLMDEEISELVRKTAMDVLGSYDKFSGNGLPRDILTNALNNPHILVRRWAMTKINQLIIQRKIKSGELIGIYRKVRETQHLDVVLWVIQGAGEISNMMIDLFQKKFDDQYNRLPDWARKHVTLAQAVHIAARLGVLEAHIIRGTQFCKTDYHEWMRGYKRFYLGDVHLKAEDDYDPHIIISTLSTKYTDLAGSPETEKGFIENGGWRDKNDFAMSNLHHLGGIALNAKMMDLQIKRDANVAPLYVSQQPPDMVDIQGLVPRIISIQPVDLSVLFGLADRR